ncbi:DM13 domain-containing protein [Vibrio sp. NTOU-M3]|uniref:DM13 domain-containing protein n=1 Tax=unclassified Vibrio TaxID=2614977 RepID=UPI00349F2BC4
MKTVFLILSHLIFGALGFALGIYALPILTQPTSPSMAIIEQVNHEALYTGSFQRDRTDSDFLHWGVGSVAISKNNIAFVGELAPGPDYKLYLSPVFIETEQSFAANKDQMVRIGDVKTFDRFTLPVDEEVNVSNYNTIVIWCETFGEFISSARYK